MVTDHEVKVNIIMEGVAQFLELSQYAKEFYDYTMQIYARHRQRS